MKLSIELFEIISIHSLVKRETNGFRKEKTYEEISIHSLVKRETFSCSFFNSPARISIHSLVKRETPILFHTVNFADNFNPLPRKEGDIAIRASITVFSISIHSLVKRETANIAKIQLKS